MADSASSPVSEAVYAILRGDATLASTLTGGWFDDVPQSPSYPYGWYEIFRETDDRGFGGGGLPRIELRTHIVSQFRGLAQAQDANRQTIALLKDVALTVTGYTMAGHIFYRDTIPLPMQEINGVKVHEIVSLFEFWVEE